MTPAGLPHSDISGSLPAYGSPKLFAADHVLLRLLAPRHPPYALIILTFLHGLPAMLRLGVVTGSLPRSVTLLAFASSMRFSKNEVVEMRGIEPLASCLQGRRSPI